MAYKIKWSPQAASHFEDIFTYIGKDSKYYASLFAKKVNALIKTIPQFLKAGRVVPEYGGENIRGKDRRHDHHQGDPHGLHRRVRRCCVHDIFEEGID